MAALLIAGGADPKLKAQDGTTLLMAAAGSGHISTSSNTPTSSTRM